MEYKTSEQIESEIAEMQKKLHTARIREGKVDVVAEVRRRILECSPDFQNLDYVLWPIRVACMCNSSMRAPSKEKRRHEKKVIWDEETEKMLLEGNHQRMIDEFGATKAALASQANRMGFKFHFGLPLSISIK